MKYDWCDIFCKHITRFEIYCFKFNVFTFCVQAVDDSDYLVYRALDNRLPPEFITPADGRQLN